MGVAGPSTSVSAQTRVVLDGTGRAALGIVDKDDQEDLPWLAKKKATDILIDSLDIQENKFSPIYLIDAETKAQKNIEHVIRASE